LSNNSFDFILHIGALRGGRNFNKDEYLKTNIKATEIFINNSTLHSPHPTLLIFCSSVGVYGTVPLELPAGSNTPFQADNLYHRTKIECERMIEQAVKEKGLQACIVRPAITYGVGDNGFPQTLVKLIHKKLLFLPKKELFIQMANVEALAEVFKSLLTNGFTSGSIWNVADREKVSFRELADFIYQRLNNTKKGYPKSRFISMWVFKLFTKLAKLIKSEKWALRFELLSNSWYFDVERTYTDFKLREYKTIPDFEVVIHHRATEIGVK
jgi:nucleoside-diphosphate-sugar epimerase